MPEPDLESAILDRGRRIFAEIRDQTPSLFDKARWTGALIDWAMQNPPFKVQLFRFVDVYPSLKTGAALAAHLEEYFGAEREVPDILRWGARAAGLGGALGAPLLRAAIQKNLEEMAGLFIIGATAPEAVQAAGRLRAEGFAAVLDLLGESTVSEREAEGCLAAYLELVAALRGAAPAWPALPPAPAGSGLDWGHAPRIQLAVKPTSLFSQANPMDFEGSVRGICDRLGRLAAAVAEADGLLCIDMESSRTKDITLEVYRRLRADPRLRDSPGLGLALQAYLRESEADLAALLAWSRERDLPLHLRLVKGAYWDSEVVVARRNGWRVPVWLRKAETDACFERLARMALEQHAHCRLACGSHNVRSIAAVLETARALEVPADRLEFQVLSGMAEPVRTALLRQTGRVRLYAPYGALVPGMAYLVRRLLENTANHSFLRQRFVEGAATERLLASPRAALEGDPAAVSAESPPAFANQPPADFTDAGLRRAFPEALAAVRRRLGRTYPLHIGGREVSTAERLDSVNPADPAEVIGRVCQAGPAEADRALSAAQAAFSAWRDTPAASRAEALEAAAAAARERLVELAAWQVLEAGKQWDQAYADVAEAIDFFGYYAAEMRRLAEPRRLAEVPGETNHLTYEPRGVALILAPWNFPLAIGAGMCAAALVAGNSVVFKPSGCTPVVGHLLLELFQAAGLPPGVFNYLPGRGAAIGDLLVDDPRVSLIGFTGSAEVGLRILARAAVVHPGQAHVKRVICEMGGKNAILVDEDADLDEAVPAILQSAFGYQGQKCSACSRAIVLEPVYDRFAARLVEAARSLSLGPAEEPAHALGPVIDGGARQAILEYIEVGRREGRLLYQSPLPPGPGHYVPLTILEGIRPEHRLAQEEVFGPVLSLMRAADFDQALEWANGTPYALTGGLFSRSPRNLERARREFRVGNLYLNRGITGALVGRQPFGGARLSGGGTKAGGADYLLHFLDGRVVTENTLRRGFTPEAAAE